METTNETTLTETTVNFELRAGSVPREVPAPRDPHLVDTPAELLSEQQLAELAGRAERAIANPRVPMLVPAHVVQTLVAGYRHHRDASTREFVGAVETSDVLDDVVDRLDAVRDALGVMKRGGTSVELRALAARALRDDDDADRGMRAEFEYGLADLGRYVRPKFKMEREPNEGEHRRDLLGNVWAVGYDADDDERECVRLRLVEAAELVQVFSLLSASERVPKRRARRRSA